MIEIRKLLNFSEEDRIVFGSFRYNSASEYFVSKKESENEISITLKEIKLDKSYNKSFQITDKIFTEYKKIISEGNSFGAYEKQKLAGVVIAENRVWNNSLWIEFIQVADNYKRCGIGTELLNRIQLQGKENHFRIIELETQNTNVPAIKFYMKCGYVISGLNMELYNKPEDKNEIAVYMSRKIISSE